MDNLEENIEYRVILEYLDDPHCIPTPPKELFRSTSLGACVNYRHLYKINNPSKGSFTKVTIQKQVMTWADVDL